MPVVCLGEALVDLIADGPAPGLAEAKAFSPHAGGATANVAVHAARLGADVALAGGCGDDELGDLLARRLEAEGVDLRFFARLAGAPTAVVLVAIDDAGDARYAFYGQGVGREVAALADRVDEAAEAATAIFFGSNTLVGAAERRVTHRLREAALQAGKPVLVDPNLRLNRWPDPDAAVAECRAVLEGAFLAKCNREEARLITGEADPASAAEHLHHELGVRLAVVTLGADGALLRGELRADAPGIAADVVSTVGAGDAFMGALLARLQLSGFYPPAAAAALPAACTLAAQVCEQAGAT